MSNLEKPKSHEVNANPEALADAGAERREALQERLERASEATHESDVESIRHEVLKEAKSSEHEKKHHEKADDTPERRKGPTSRAERDESFTAAMSEIQTHMSAPSRAFSKLIHNKAVETVSDAVGNTVARPNAILSGSVFAFIATISVFLIAKNIGFELTGFETIGAFTFGWALGLVYDFLRVMITGRK